ncbi:DUF4233 domain-containing protein [Quadrisphaera sp. DSM 44207]|uniref:DUF4233 domain-containing protein n=1 Tax=Quadrisphaera sp. DSM 44207 TaxID=1881057 RepID=UPI000B82C60A|nr:DUF4233 domain-containing protein [Quadrisphaera sp. DSM 44207]
MPPPVMTARLAATVLLMEALLAFFATLVAFALVAGQGGLGRGQVWVVGLALALAFLVAAGLVRRPGGLVVGTVLQGVLIATGVVVPAMFLVGALFAGLWLWIVSVGRRIDADRRRWARDLAAQQARSRPPDPGPPA